MIANLSELEFLQGLFALIFVTISVVIGIRILLKYFSLKQPEYITIGLTWIFMGSAWARACVNFVFFLIFGVSSGLGIAIDVIFLPVALMCWIYSFSHLIYPDSEKKIVLAFGAICIPVEIITIIFLIIQPELIATAPTPFNNEFTLFFMIFLIFILLSTLITGVIFAVKSMAYDDKRIQWRGRFLLIAFISFVISALIDAIFPITALTLVLARVLLISSAIEYYIGFHMPERIAKLLIKE